MKNLWVGLASVTLLLLLTSDAWAQPGGGRGGARGMSRAMLLMNEAVQDELEVSDTQREELGEILGALRGGRGGQRGEGQRGERGQRGEGGQEGERGQGERGQRGAGGEAMREAETKALAVLDEDQRDRLLGIYMWVAGANAFSDPEVAKKVGISEEQQEEIAAVLQEAGEEMRSIMQEMRDSGDMEGMREAMTKFRSELEEDVLKMLSEDQQAKVKRLKGDKFEMEFFGRGRGGGN